MANRSCGSPLSSRASRGRRPLLTTCLGTATPRGSGWSSTKSTRWWGGENHDLTKPEIQDKWIDRVENGDFDIVIHSPPCGSWSRANYANNLPPKPCRSQRHPWRFPHNSLAQRKRAEKGDIFVHFTIRAIQAAQRAKARGFQVASLLEHPEDLGRTHRGEPASIWQLPDLRSAFGCGRFWAVAGHQCQFDVDFKKPTRIFSDIEGMEDFGFCGWPQFDAGGWYTGPLPKDRGHDSLGQEMIGEKAGGGYNTSPTAAYPPNICEFFAVRMFNHWKRHLISRPPIGQEVTTLKSRRAA